MKRDFVFGGYDKFATQCSYPLAVKEAVYEERAQCVGASEPTWNASLKVDIDGRNPLRMARLRTCAAYLAKRGYKVTRVHMGKTRKGWHLRIWLDPYIGGSTYEKPYTVLKLQAMLGDDPMRQAFNLGRVRRKRKGFNILFTKKIVNGQAVSEEVFDRKMTSKVAMALIYHPE